MASEVTIANLALANLGDSATVSSLSPPEGSPQAEHCARFYPLARDAMLEAEEWTFATTRLTLAPVANPTSTWQYAYAVPNNVLSMLAVIAADAPDDYVASLPSPNYVPGDILYMCSSYPSPLAYTPQPYSVEMDGGNPIILTNVPNAVLRCKVRVTDPTKFPPLFVTALSWLLASMLAGPILKGDAGHAAAVRCLGFYETWKGKAITADANDGMTRVTPVTPWIAGR